MQLQFIEMAKLNFLRIILFILIGVFTAVQAQDNSDFSTHNVKKKETLYAISKMYGMTVAELKRLNNLNDNTIYVNQPLIVTGNNSDSRPRSRTAGIAFQGTEDRSITRFSFDESSQSLGIGNSRSNASRSIADNNMYTTTSTLSSRLRSNATDNKVLVERRQWYRVQDGDDLFSISDTYEVGISELQSWNNTDDVNPGDIIIVGKYYEEVENPALDEATGRSVARNEPLEMRSSEAIRYLEARDRALGRLNRNESSRRDRFDDAELNVNIGTAFLDDSYTTNIGTVSSNRIPVVRTSDRMIVYADPASRKIQEKGPFIKFEIPGYERYRFYGAHKILPPGSKVKLDIPNNSGYLEVTIIDRLPVDSPALIGLSPGCIQVIGGNTNRGQVTILYD